MGRDDGCDDESRTILSDPFGELFDYVSVRQNLMLYEILSPIDIWIARVNKGCCKKERKLESIHHNYWV